MSCLPEADSEPNSSWALWLDLWAQAVRHPEVAGVRQKFDERWRDLICSLVVAGQEARSAGKSAEELSSMGTGDKARGDRGGDRNGRRRDSRGGGRDRRPRERERSE